MCVFVCVCLCVILSETECVCVFACVCECEFVCLCVCRMNGVRNDRRIERRLNDSREVRKAGRKEGGKERK